MLLRITLCLILSLHINILYSQYFIADYAIKIITKERKGNHLIFDYKLDIEISKSDKTGFVEIPLPFGYNPDLKIIVEPQSDHNMVYYGFCRPDATGGICKVEQLNKASKVYITIKNADLTLQETGKNESIDAAILSFKPALIILKNDTNMVVKLKNMTVYSDELKYSIPESKSSDESPNEHKINIGSTFSYNDNITLFFSELERSKTLIHFVFFIIALTFALFSSPTIILNSINWSITLSVVSFVLLIILSIFFYKEVYSTPIIKEYDLSGGIMGGIGLFIGLLINSTRNAIRLKRVNRVQGAP